MYYVSMIALYLSEKNGTAWSIKLRERLAGRVASSDYAALIAAFLVKAILHENEYNSVFSN